MKRLRKGTVLCEVIVAARHDIHYKHAPYGYLGYVNNTDRQVKVTVRIADKKSTKPLEF